MNEFWQGFFNDFVDVFENGAKAPPVLLINLILGGMSLSVCPYFACLLGKGINNPMIKWVHGKVFEDVSKFIFR